MDNNDITESVFDADTGIVTISNLNANYHTVTGDIIITAGISEE